MESFDTSDDYSVVPHADNQSASLSDVDIDFNLDDNHQDDNNNEYNYNVLIKKHDRNTFSHF